MNSARKNIEAMRELLEMPPRDEQLWLRMKNNQRRAVLMAAGLPLEWSERFWQHFTNRERIKILDQINEFATWKQKLQAPAGTAL